MLCPTSHVFHGKAAGISKTHLFPLLQEVKQRAWLYSSISKPSPTWCFRAVLLCANISFTPHWHNKPVVIKCNKHQQKSELMGSRCLVMLPFKAGWQPRVWLYSLADTDCHQAEENKAWDCKNKQFISELGLEKTTKVLLQVCIAP